MHHAINNGYDYVFFVDSDIVFDADTLNDLYIINEDIVSGVYRQRNLERNIPEIYVRQPNGGTDNIDPDFLNSQTKPFEIAGCGFGCVLVKIDVLKKMTYPHFFYKDSIDFSETVSEDTYFCEKAKLLGFKILCNPMVQCGHIGNFEIYFKKWQ